MAWSDGPLAQKTESGPISGSRDCVDTICADVCSSPTSYRGCVFLDQPLQIVSTNRVSLSLISQLTTDGILLYIFLNNNIQCVNINVQFIFMFKHVYV